MGYNKTTCEVREFLRMIQPEVTPGFARLGTAYERFAVSTWLKFPSILLPSGMAHALEATCEKI